MSFFFPSSYSLSFFLFISHVDLSMQVFELWLDANKSGIAKEKKMGEGAGRKEERRGKTG